MECNLIPEIIVTKKCAYNAVQNLTMLNVYAKNFNFIEKLFLVIIIYKKKAT